MRSSRRPNPSFQLDLFHAPRRAPEWLALPIEVREQTKRLLARIQCRPTYQDEPVLERLLSEFAEALLCGTMSLEGDDPAELYWPSLSFSSAKTYIRQVTDFSDFCVEQYGSESLNPWTAAHWGERIAAMRRWDARNKGSLLRHISDRKAAWAQSTGRRSVDLGYSPKQFH